MSLGFKISDLFKYNQNKTKYIVNTFIKVKFTKEIQIDSQQFNSAFIPR